MNQDPEYTEIIDDADENESLDIGGDSLSPSEIYDELIKHSPLIVTIPSDQLNALRAGISNAKYLANQKLEKAALKPDTRRIVFERLGGDTDGTIRVRIAFRIGQINVISIEKERI